jgi:hypothetical protein
MRARRIVMPIDDEAARKARAERLRADIKARKSGASDPAKPAATADQPAPGESPREFIERRMREQRDKEAAS